MNNASDLRPREPYHGWQPLDKPTVGGPLTEQFHRARSFASDLGV